MSSTAFFVLGSLSVLVGMTAIILAVGILRSVLRSERAGNERLEILREQQQRLKVMYQERSILQVELERLRSAMDEEERLLELPAPAEPIQPNRRPWWRMVLRG
jgi:hypothetical protein